MKALRVVVPVLIAGALMAFVATRVAARNDADGYRTQREALQREMIERSAVARGLGDPAGVEEARAVLRWWFEGAGALRKRFPGPSRTDDPATHRGQGPAQERGDSTAWFKYAEESVASLRAGYAPALSGSDQGLRLDILAIRPGEHPDSHERALRVDFALWGAPRRIDREVGEGPRSTSRVVVPLAFRQIGFRFLDAAGKAYGEMTGTGEPYLVLKDPERFSGDLPPGVALGTWWVDAFPREAARVEMSVSAHVQGMGPAALTPTFKWEIPVADDWKLRPGEAFRAEIRSAPPEPPRR